MNHELQIWSTKMMEESAGNSMGKGCDKKDLTNSTKQFQ